jgi:hypothetical protein
MYFWLTKNTCERTIVVFSSLPWLSAMVAYIPMTPKNTIRNKRKNKITQQIYLAKKKSWHLDTKTKFLLKPKYLQLFNVDIISILI